MAADTLTYYELLYELLATTPSVVIRRGATTHGELGMVQHANGIVTVNRAASAPDFASTLIQATVELHRGSARAPDRTQEAAKTRALAAGIAVHPVLSLLDHNVEPEALARSLGVDVATVLLALQLAAADGAGPTTR
jgi:hypothetical protein